MSVAEPIRKPNIKKTIDRLKKINVVANSDLIPGDIGPLLKKLKSQLVGLVLKDLIIEGDGVFDLKRIQKVKEGIFSELKNDGIGLGHMNAQVVEGSSADNSEYFQYGDINSIDIESVSGYPGLIIGTTSIGLACGDDNSLYIFSKNEGEWKFIFSDQVDEYGSTELARGDFNFGFLKGNDRNRLFLITVYVSPACNSNWTRIFYSVFKIDLLNSKTVEIYKNNQSIFVGNDEPYYSLETGLNDFALKFYGNKPQSADLYFRTIKFNLNNDHVFQTSVSFDPNLEKGF